MHKCINNSIGNVYHLEQFVDEFFPYSQKQLGFDKPVAIRFESDPDNAEVMLGKTAYYDPNAMEIALYIDGRHPKDVMRSLSHELVHHAQNCRGDFTGADSTSAGYAQEDPHLRKMEREAYTKGNLIFRDFEDLIKTGKINIEINFSDSGEPKMSLKEWKNNEINTKLMQKWGLLKEEKMPMKTDDDDADGDGETDDQVPAFLEEDSGDTEKRHAERNVAADEKHIKDLEKDEKYEKEEEKLEEEQPVFAPNHYCVHHGGVQHEGKIKMAEAINHNFDKNLNKVTWYDMKLQDGTILEQVAADDIMVTNASMAEGHMHRVEDEDDLDENYVDLAKRRGQYHKALTADDLSGLDKESEKDPADYTGTRKREKKAVSALKRGKGLEETTSGKISVREAKQITRRIIERIRKEGK